MQINFLFPSEPFSVKNIDSGYSEEFHACLNAGFSYSLIDIEMLNENRMVLNQRHTDLQDNNTVFIYRGWMLKEKQYKVLEDGFSKLPTSLLTDTKTYLASHHLPNWYESIKELTIKTEFSDVENFLHDIQQKNLLPCFIKDYVKSLTTERGSICKTKEDAQEVVQNLISYRGEIEGGLCIRELVELKPDTEERYFVFNGKAYSRVGKQVPDIVNKIALIHKAPFFSVDVVEKVDGSLIVIEIGDGQVSDVKQWNNDGWEKNPFYQIFKE